jgi:putative transposase
MCRLLKVSRSCYYSCLHSPPSATDLKNQRLFSLIKDSFYNSHCVYGSRRIRKELQNKGEIISRRRVCKLMKSQSLCCKTRKKFRVTTDSNHSLEVSPNLLERDFSASATDQKYVGDITYIRTNQGWMYLAVVIDLFSRRIVGWAMDKRMHTKLVNDALLMAIWSMKPKAGLIWHTDRGSQYASESHRSLLKLHEVTQSMSRKGNCWDNAVSESFFHTLKTELTYHYNFETRQEAKQIIFKYIEVFYNRQRLHSSNNYEAPAVFEKNMKTI